MVRHHGKHDIDPQTKREFLTDPPKEGPAGGSARNNPYSVNPSSPLHQGNSSPQEIEYIPTDNESEETHGAYRRRVSTNDYTKNQRRVTRMSRGLLAAIIVVLSLAVAAIVGWNVYVASISSNLSSGYDTTASSSLTEITSGQPYYALAVGTDNTGTNGAAVVSSITLLYIDAANSHITLLSLPTNTYTSTLSSYETLADYHAEYGLSDFIAAVEDLTGIKVSHYIQFDTANAVGLVDSLGGVSVEVPTNTSYDGVSVASGQQTLNSSQALILSRCVSGYQTGIKQQMLNQRNLMSAIIQVYSTKPFLTQMSLLSDYASCIHTDMGALEMLEAFTSLSDGDNPIYTGVAPTSIEVIDGESFSIIDDEQMASTIAVIESGGDPESEATKALTSVTASSYSVFIRNGSGVSGCAQQASALLSAAGYGIQGTGNADAYVYDETLVVYNTSDQQSVAQAIVNTLGIGRSVQNAGNYTFEGDLLVVVGKDWIPT